MNRGGLFWGRVTAEALGEEPERFFNLLSRREIPVYDIREEDAPSAAESGKNGKLRAVLFTAAPEDMKRMKPIARKAGVRLRAESRFSFFVCGGGSFSPPALRRFSFSYISCLCLSGIFLSKAISVLRRKRSSIIWIRFRFPAECSGQRSPAASLRNP